MPTGQVAGLLYKLQAYWMRTGLLDKLQTYWIRTGPLDKLQAFWGPLGSSEQPSGLVDDPQASGAFWGLTGRPTVF